MYKLKTVTIFGLWDRDPVQIPFYPDVNFLIGPNGSGKTTVINLLAATLSGDHKGLDQVPFTAIDVVLISPANEETTVNVRRSRDEKSGLPRIVYQFADDPEEYELLRREGVYYSPAARARLSPVFENLRRLVHLTWLSIHRTPSKPTSEDRSFDSTVDKKLIQLGNEFVRFFSRIAFLREAQRIKFQQKVFLALLGGMEEELGDLLEVSETHVQDEERVFAEIFESLDLESSEYAGPLAQHFQLIRAASQNRRAGKQLTISEVGVLITSLPIHRVSLEWHKLSDRLHTIDAPMTGFLEIINGLVRRKGFSLSIDNELIVTLNDQQRAIPLTALSSGEKQLLIILGEALLQRKREYLFIADEPELSLHMEWQEKLVPHLIRINPNAQLVFATHSPDIVGAYESRIVDMGALFGDVSKDS